MLVVRALARLDLFRVDLDLGRGERVSVEGASGVGKSQLLRAIADLDPNSGRVRLDGADRTAMSGPAWRGRVVYLASGAGWWSPRVAEHFEGADCRRRAADLVPRLGLDEAALDWPVSRLSSGERQRLALVRALVREPRVLLLDEPTANLDEKTTAAVETLLAEIAAAGTAMAVVTHSPDQATRLVDRRLRLADGRLDAIEDAR